MGIHPAAVVLAAALGTAQLLPPPGDGDIRTVFWALRNTSETWLTLEPRSVAGDRAPVITFTCRFQGTRQTAPPQEVEIQASAGRFWAPRAELWFELDDTERVDLSAQPAITGLLEGTPDSWSARTSIDTVYRMALVRRIRGSALGFPFEFSASQRQPIRAFLARVDPGGLPPAMRPRE
jgi:hypothetical protein